MSNAYTGGCSCGAVRFEIRGEPIAMLDCQCRQCQQESGTGHQSHVTFQAAEVKLTGQTTAWEAVGDEGTRKVRTFCPTCGAPVSMTFPDIPDVFAVRASSLDDPGLYRPQMVVWAAAAQPWDRVDPALPHFERMPPQ